MRRAHVILPLALVTLVACQAADDPSTGNVTIHEDHFSLKPIGH